MVLLFIILAVFSDKTVNTGESKIIVMQPPKSENKKTRIILEIIQEMICKNLKT